MKDKIKRTNVHHRRSRSRTGGKKFNGEILGISNIIRVDWKKHQAFHMLFPDTDPIAITHELNNIWIDPEKMLLCVPRSIANEIIKHYAIQA